MVEQDLIKISDNDGVRTLVLNRPHQLNAFDKATIVELARILQETQTNTNVRALVLTGEGRAFSSGADISEDSELSLGSDDAWSRAMHSVIGTLYHLRVPTIAAINGLAVGAGLDLALACNIRIAADTAWVSEGYVDIGYSPDAGATFLLTPIVGAARAAEMIFTGQRVAAKTAHDWGLVSEVVTEPALAARVAEFARAIAAKPPIAVELAKRLLLSNSGSSLETALDNELLAGRICGATEDHREGVSALMERREPVFHGR